MFRPWRFQYRIVWTPKIVVARNLLSMTTEEQISFTVSAFLSVLDDSARRIKRSTRLRDQIHEALMRGDEPDHYRVEWMRESVVEIFSLLETIATKFNEAHPDDVCTSQDFEDLLASTLATLNSARDRS